MSVQCHLFEHSLSYDFSRRLGWSTILRISTLKKEDTFAITPHHLGITTSVHIKRYHCVNMAVNAAATVDPNNRKNVLRVIFVSLLLDLVRLYTLPGLPLAPLLHDR